jgi:uncharacterized coiled-coil protein SlyX
MSACHFASAFGAGYLNPSRPPFHPETRVARLDFIVAGRQDAGMAEEHFQRIERLEASLAHLERQVDQLNGVIIEQGKWLDRLKKEVQRQSTAMQTLELERVKANITKPPHYQ